MGGPIVVHIAEKYLSYDGCLAIGAALIVRELIPNPLQFTHGMCA